MTDAFTPSRLATLRDQIGAADDPELGLALLDAIERRDARIAELEEKETCYRAAIDTIGPIENERDTALARVAALEDLVCSAAPLAWAVTMDQDAAQAWERRATELVRAATTK